MANSAFQYPVGGGGSALIYWRDGTLSNLFTITATAGNDKITLAATPYTTAVTTVQIETSRSGGPFTEECPSFTGLVGTFASLLNSGDKVRCKYWTTGTPSASLLSGTLTLATFDPTKQPSNITLSGGNLTAAGTSSYNTNGCTRPRATGKWACNSTGTSNDYFLGIGCADTSGGVPWVNGGFIGHVAAGNGYGFENYNGQLWIESVDAALNFTQGGSGGAGTGTLTMLLNLDSSPQTLKFYAGNTLLNSINLDAALAGKSWVICASPLNTDSVTINAGQSTITIPTPEAGVGYSPFWA